MAKITPPPNVRIAALRTKKAIASDPMASGGGTPWEDRGSIGTAKAFFLTCLMSMKSPKLLFASIRRLDTTGEAMAFTLACGMLWGIGILLSGVILLAYAATRPNAIIDPRLFAIQYGALTIGMVAAVFVLTWLAARILNTLLAAEMKTKVPPSLIANLLAYCLGPSVLAVIPFIGVPIAAIGILALMIVACISRLHVSTRGAVTCSIITFGAMLMIVVIVGAMWWALAWQQWCEIKPPPPPPVIRYLQ